jgi:diguanylate cyclase (GGDEF)-like protein/PAS domain S-box-containing protein
MDMECPAADEARRADGIAAIGRAVVEHSSEFVVVLGPDGTITYANRAAVSVFGRAGASLAGRNAFDVVHPHEQDTAVHALAATSTRPGTHSPVEFRLRDASGEWRIFDVLATNLLDDPAVHGVVVQGRDVTARARAIGALVESETRFRCLVENSPDIVAILYPDGEWSATDQGTRLLGYPKGYEVDGGVFALIHPDDVGPAAAALKALLDGTRPGGQPLELRIRHADGHYVDFECVAQNLIDDETIGGVVVTARNITERKQMQRALRAAEDRFKAVFERTPISVSLVDLNGDIRDINNAGCALTGRSREELVGTPAANTVHPDDIDAAIEATIAQLGGATEKAEFRILRPDGTMAWVLSKASLIDPGGDGDPYVVTSQTDITARRELEERLTHEATRDPLTNLFNRGAFLTQLELALARRSDKPIAVLFADLDYFKDVNDSLGHDAGDTVLAVVAKRLEQTTRNGDIIARFGGDEFVILCHDVADQAEGDEIAARVRAVVDNRIDVRGVPVHLGISVGIAISHEHSTPDELLRAADRLAYKVKRSNRTRLRPTG